MIVRIWNLAIKELLHLWRDKMILLFVFMGPISELALVAWATSGDIEHIPTAIVDRDRSAASRALVQALENTETFEANYYPRDEEEARALVDAGTVLVALLIPLDFEEQLVSVGESAQVQLILDGADPSAARAAQMSAEGAVGAFAQQVSLQRLGQLDSWGEVIDVDMRVWFNEELKTSNYEVPSELGFMLVGVALMVASLGTTAGDSTSEHRVDPWQSTACHDLVLSQLPADVGTGRLCLSGADAGLMVVAAGDCPLLFAGRDGMGPDDLGGVQNAGAGTASRLHVDDGGGGFFGVCLSRGEYAVAAATHREFRADQALAYRLAQHLAERGWGPCVLEGASESGSAGVGDQCGHPLLLAQAVGVRDWLLAVGPGGERCRMCI
jgi:hypothetical protein